MPIPEPGIYRPSNLTKQQQAEQLAAAYGVDMNEQPLTHEEAAQMRQLLARFDSESKPIQTFDLNNPPREPYRHLAFPRMLYKIGGVITVQNDAQMSAAIEQGWSTDASLYHAEVEDHLSAKLQMEADQVQEKIEELKRRRGRPRKED